MRADDRILYRERWHWAQWVNVLYWGSMVACVYPLLAGWGSDAPFGERVFLAAAVAMTFVFLMWFIGGTTVLVKVEEVQVSLGSVPLVRKRIPYADIVSLESVRYHPLKEFGGWGVRGFGQKQAWSARGDQAVVLHLVGGKALYVGTDTPYRLEERIRSAAGDQLGQNA